MNKLLTFVIIINGCVLLSACAPVLVGAGAVGGYHIAQDSDSFGEYIDDSTITTKIKSSYLANKEISSMNISVYTRNGVVELTGHVRSQAIKNSAGKIAIETKGVKAVKNLLIVR